MQPALHVIFSQRRTGMVDFSKVKSTYPEIYEAMELELKRQEEHIELIASENFVSEAVM